MENNELPLNCAFSYASLNYLHLSANYHSQDRDMEHGVLSRRNANVHVFQMLFCHVSLWHTHGIHVYFSYVAYLCALSINMNWQTWTRDILDRRTPTVHGVYEMVCVIPRNYVLQTFLGTYRRQIFAPPPWRGNSDRVILDHVYW